MTFNKYLFFRAVRIVGYSRKKACLADATSESHLLKEAETFLGQAIWRKTENIEALSMEHWNLRKLTKDQDRILKEIEHFQEKFNESCQLQAEESKTSAESLDGVINERRETLVQMDLLTRDRDQIAARIHEIQRNYSGLEMKKEVLAKEGEKLGEIEKTSSRLEEISKELVELNQQKEKITENISKANSRIQEIETFLNDQRKQGKIKGAETFQSIGDANQQISVRRAELNAINNQMRRLHTETGRYISSNFSKNGECQKAGKTHRGLIDVMGALRKSITYNQKLADH